VSSSRPEIQEALLQLDELTRRLRRECPWDREQDERSIVPHTLEEAYELGDAAQQRDDRKMLDELGDVLFQVHFLALLLEERGAGDLAAVAEHTRQKLIRRHPHVFSDTEVDSAADVLKNWDQIKKGEDGRERGVFGEVPENLPSLLYARKVQRRAASSGLDVPGHDVQIQAVRDQLDELERVADAEGEEGRDARYDALGDVLFAAANVARKLQVDPELALRSSSERFRGRVETAVQMASADGREWDDLAPEQQLSYYARARMASD